MADPQRDAPIGEILSALFPASGTAVIPKVVKVALGQAAGNAGVLAWQNPESVGVLAAVVIDRRPLELRRRRLQRGDVPQARREGGHQRLRDCDGQRHALRPRG